MARLSFWEIKRHLPAVVVGSSLGAVVALEAARIALKAPLVLIAPALGFGSRWTEKLPEGDPVRFFHFGEERELPIHRRFFTDFLNEVRGHRESCDLRTANVLRASRLALEAQRRATG